MKIIAFEGLDKSGKYSASEALVTYLKEKGYRVEKSEFHRYDTPTGELVLRWLCGEWDVDQHTIELVMAADKQAQQKWFTELEESGVEYLILDRYIGSQDVYAIANHMSILWVKSLQRYMRKPDMEILLDITAEESMKRKGKHNNGENDRYESDRQLLENVRVHYLQQALAKPEETFVVDAMQPIQEVHQEVIRIFDEEIGGQS